MFGIIYSNDAGIWHAPSAYPGQTKPAMSWHTKHKQQPLWFVNNIDIWELRMARICYVSCLQVAIFLLPLFKEPPFASRLWCSEYHFSQSIVTICLFPISSKNNSPYLVVNSDKDTNTHYKSCVWHVSQCCQGPIQRITV